MKRLFGIAAACLMAVSLFAQKIPENRDLFVGVWKFAEENNYQDISKYSQPLEVFLKKEYMNDVLFAPIGATTVKRSFDFTKGNCLDLYEDEYRVLTPQLDKGMGGKWLHIFDWTIKNENGNLFFKLNNSITALVDKNGDWTPNSEFKRAKIVNVKQIEKLASADLMKYILVSDAEYEKNKKEVASSLGFLLSIVPNMTELALEDFINENDIYNTETKINLKVFDVSKNDMKVKGYTPNEYAYKIYGTNGKAYIWGFSNSSVFNKAKKDSNFSCKGKIKNIRYRMLKTEIYFVAE